MQHWGIELFLRGLVLWLLAAITLALFGRAAAAYRHLICVLALGGLQTLPLAQRLTPPLLLLPPQTTAAVGRTPAPKQEVSRRDNLPELPAPLKATQESGKQRPPLALARAESPRAAHDITDLPRFSRHRHSRNAPAVVLAIWGLGVAIRLLRLLIALLHLRRLKARSRQTVLNGVPIWISEQIQTPLTWGLRRSVIVLPAALLTGDQAVCASALRHEQAHIARWDWMWNLLAELICALCWFQPGAWWLRGRLRLESERACDDRVLLSGVAGPDYAGHLLAIVRSAHTHEVAPAMAGCRGMEERMRHILDDAKPRHASPKWLFVAALFVLTLLFLAALRVSARPAEAKAGTDRSGAARDLNAAPYRPSKPTDPTEKRDAAHQGNVPQAGGSPAATLDNVNPAVPLEKVVWGKVVDGLEPGILLTTPDFPNNRRVPLNSHVAYQVLVRNVSNRERSFELRCGSSNLWNRDPYLIPSDELGHALSSGVLPERFRARGVTDLALSRAAYDVKLAPGEAVVVPGELKLYIGDADQQSFPRIETIKAGMNWIVQPVTIRRLTAAEQVQAERIMSTPYSEKRVVTTVDRNGKIGQRSVPLVGAGSGGKQLFAGVQLEVGTNRDWTLTTHSKSVNVEVFSPDSKRLLTGSADGSAIVWDVATGRSVLTLQGSTAPISSVLYSPNGKFIFTGCSDGAIHIWDAATGESLHALAGPGGGVCALGVSSDGTKLLGGYEGGQVVIWNTSTGQAAATCAYDNRLLSAAISPDGKNIAAGYWDATLKVWDLRTRQSLLSRRLAAGDGITEMHFDRNNTLYTWRREDSKDGKSKVMAMTAWGIEAAENGKFVMLSIINCPCSEKTIRHAVAYDTFAMIYGQSDGQAVLNNMQDGPVTVDAHDGAVATVAISPDGTLGATGGQRNGRGEAKIWDMLAHKPARQAR